MKYRIFPNDTVLFGDEIEDSIDYAPINAPSDDYYDGEIGDGCSAFDCLINTDNRFNTLHCTCFKDVPTEYLDAVVAEWIDRIN